MPYVIDDTDCPTGFTADVVQRVIQNTILNPVLTLPLWILSRYTFRGQGYALDHPTAVKRLKLLIFLGIARWIHNILNDRALNNWKTANFDWKKELVVVTGGSDGIGKQLVLLFASRNIKVVILDIQPPTFTLREPPLQVQAPI